MPRRVSARTSPTTRASSSSPSPIRSTRSIPRSRKYWARPGATKGNYSTAERRRMRIMIQTLGTRGDVQPYVALAGGLQQAGHRVLLAAPEQFRGFAERDADEYPPLPAGSLQLMETPEPREPMRGRDALRAGLRPMRRV